MLNETVFRSEDLPPADRFDCWRELMSRTHAPMDLYSDHASDFWANQRVIELGALSVYPMAFLPLVFRRTPKLIRQSDPEAYHLTFVVRGTGHVTRGKQNVSHHACDIHSNDTSQPYEIHTGPERIQGIGVEIPKALLPLTQDRADRAIGRRMSGRSGVGALLAQFLTQLSADTSGYRPSDGPRLGTVLGDLVAATFAHVIEADRHLPPETHQRVSVLRVKSFIRQHLGDPRLNPRAIAAAHHISPSYLHRLFQKEGDGTTVAGFLLAQRLEGARHDLSDPARSAEPVHVIAARWGFAHAASFSRAFRSAYGTAPSDFRHEALG